MKNWFRIALQSVESLLGGFTKPISEVGTGVTTPRPEPVPMKTPPSSETNPRQCVMYGDSTPIRAPTGYDLYRVEWKQNYINITMTAWADYARWWRAEASKKRTVTLPPVEKRRKGQVKSHYAVAVGRQNDVIVHTWDECKKLVTGYDGAAYRGYYSESKAREYLDAYKIGAK